MCLSGDLYFAYALREDDLRGKIYKGVMFNPVVDLTAGGSYTLVKVKPGRQPFVQPFPPALSLFLSSAINEIALYYCHLRTLALLSSYLEEVLCKFSSECTRGEGQTLAMLFLPVQGGVQPFPPALAFSSPNETIGLEGTTINLNCFFNG